MRPWVRWWSLSHACGSGYKWSASLHSCSSLAYIDEDLAGSNFYIYCQLFSTASDISESVGSLLWGNSALCSCSCSFPTNSNLATQSKNTEYRPAVADSLLRDGLSLCSQSFPLYQIVNQMSCKCLLICEQRY